MKGRSSGMLYWLTLSLVVTVADQLIKQWVSATFELYERLSVVPSFFSLTLVHNTGAAFSFLSNQGGWQRWFFVSVAVLVSAVLTFWLAKMKRSEWWQACAVALILGGGLGNLIDRVFHGYVVDYLLVYYESWYFPAFNLADAAISVGAGMMILDALRKEKK